MFEPLDLVSEWWQSFLFQIILTCSKIISLVGDATSIILVTTKHIFCHNESMLAVNLFFFLFSKYFCHDKTFVMTNICHDKHVFVVTLVTRILLLRQVSCYKYNFFLTKYVFCHDKSMLAMTKLLS